MVDVEQDVISSGIDDNLRNEIGQAKQSKPLPKKYIILIAVVLVLIIASVSAYFVFMPKTQNVTIHFQLNGSPLKQDLNVGLLYGSNTDYEIFTAKDGDLEETPLPLGTVDVKVYTKGFEYTDNFDVDKDTTDQTVDIKKNEEPPKEEKKPVKVSFSIYAPKDQVNPYTSPVDLTLQCVNSGKKASLEVTGTGEYTKAADCGTLNVTGEPSGFMSINKPCSSESCKIILQQSINFEASTVTSQNNLYVHVTDATTDSNLSDVNVSVVSAKGGVPIIKTTQENGFVEFDDLEIGMYSLQAQAIHDGQPYSLQRNDVNINADAPTTENIAFNFANGNFKVIIDANTELGCNFDVEMFDKNSWLSTIKSVDANRPINFTLENPDDMNTRPYYFTVIPLDKCKKVYEPIYNLQLEYPKDNGAHIKMYKMVPKDYVFLNVIPKYTTYPVGNVNVKIRESDNNRFMLSDVSGADGIAGPFVLERDINYFVQGGNNSVSGSTYYKFTPPKEELKEGEFYDANLDLPLKIDSADVNINFKFGSDDLNFKVYANWIIPGASNINFSNVIFDGNHGVAVTKVPTGIPILFKIVYSVDYKSGLTFTYNYYLNKMIFGDENYTVYANLPVSLSSDNSDTSSSFEGFYDNAMMDGSPVIDGALTGNQTYYAVVNSLGIPARTGCLTTSGDKEGLVFSAEPDGKTFDVEDVSLYNTEDMKNSTFGYKFNKTKLVPATLSKNNFVENIFRVVTKIKTYNLNGNMTSRFGYLVSDMAGYSESHKNITVEKGTDNFVHPNNIIDLNVAKESTVTLDLNSGMLQMIRSFYGKDSKYKIEVNKWTSVANSNSNCDPYSKDSYVKILLSDFNLNDGFKDVKLNIDTGKATKEISMDTDKIDDIVNLPVRFDLTMYYDLNQIDNDGKIRTLFENHSIPVIVNVNKGDKPQLNCFTVSVNKNPLKFVYSSDDEAVYLKNGFIYNMVAKLKSDDYLKSDKYYDILFLHKTSPKKKNNRGILGINHGINKDIEKQIMEQNKVVISVENNCDFDVNVKFPDADNESFILDKNSTLLTLNKSEFENKPFSVQIVYTNKKADKKESIDYRVFAPKPAKIYPKDLKSKLKPRTEYVPPIQTNDSDINCHTHMCSREFFAKYVSGIIERSGHKSVIINLMDDNFEDFSSLNGAVGKFGISDGVMLYAGPGKYAGMYLNLFGLQSKIVDFAPTKAIPLNDQIFYYLPPKTLDAVGTKYNNMGIGMCTDGPVSVYISNDIDAVAPCHPGTVRGYKKLYYEKEDFDMSNFYKFLDAKRRGDTNDVNLNVYPGVQITKCKDLNSDCYGKGVNLQDILNNTVKNERYYALVDGNLYDLNDLFYIKDNKFESKGTSPCKIIKISQADVKEGDVIVPKYGSNVNEVTITPYAGQQVIINKVIDFYNQNFLYVVRNGDNTDYNYYLNIPNIVNYYFDYKNYNNGYNGPIFKYPFMQYPNINQLRLPDLSYLKNMMQNSSSSDQGGSSSIISQIKGITGNIIPIKPQPTFFGLPAGFTSSIMGNGSGSSDTLPGSNQWSMDAIGHTTDATGTTYTDITDN